MIQLVKYNVHLKSNFFSVIKFCFLRSIIFFIIAIWAPIVVQASEVKHWFPPTTGLQKKEDGIYTKVRKRLFPHPASQWLFIRPRPIKKGEKELSIAKYQSEDKIVFDAKKNTLSLHGPSLLEYDNMKLEANLIALDLSSSVITAEGTKDLHDKLVGSPVFTYKDVKKDKYGKEGSPTPRVFFMERVHYNVHTKRALVDKLITKHEDSIIKSNQIKGENEQTFYADDLIYTTCSLKNPHFYIRLKRAKVVQDQQITSGPFSLYFDNVPTVLGCTFGTLFLEGKRTHGIIPPEIGEGDNGFYLRNGGYHINFKDYAAFSILGSIYSNGMTELKNELHYKKRYLCDGSMRYTRNSNQSKVGWSMQWTHKTLSQGVRSFNTHFDLRNDDYNKLDKEEVKIKSALNKKSSANITYQDKLKSYRLTMRAQFNKNLDSKFTHITLPETTLSGSWNHPLKVLNKATQWFQGMDIGHTIKFENHFKNAKQDTTKYFNPTNDTPALPSTMKWNRYAQSGILHTVPLSVKCKLFTYFSLAPSFNWSEAWYWEKLSFEEEDMSPVYIPGFNRVYSWDIGGTLQTTLYHTRYFNEEQLIRGYRIKTEPSVSLTYTPDFSSEKYGYFQEIKKAGSPDGKIEKKYRFKDFLPGKSLQDRASCTLTCAVHNTIELKVNRPIDAANKEKKRTSYKIPLLKKLDVNTTYDFKAKECHLTNGIGMAVASEAKLWNMVKFGFDLTATIDPYLFKVENLDNGRCEEKKIDVFAWNHGKYLGRIQDARLNLSMHIEAKRNREKKKKSFSEDIDDLYQKEKKEHKIDFEAPWNVNFEFGWDYKRNYIYKLGENNYTKTKYLNFNGNVTLVKKWKLSVRGKYDLNTNKLNPDATEISIQRDLHCWQLSYQWHPVGNQYKYDFSLGVKSNVLKLLKLPRKRSYNKLS
ncbi:MAG: hypothetical protein K2X94_05110 [Amoebophilaceae bacterium]|nr:hypothetical protein [Amoebophilaceae bacterium]